MRLQLTCFYGVESKKTRQRFATLNQRVVYRSLPRIHGIPKANLVMLFLTNLHLCNHSTFTRCVYAVLLFTFQSGFADETVFESRIRPLLLNECVTCHGPQRQEAGLRFDQRESTLKGIASDQPLVVPGKPQQSRIWQVVQHSEDDLAMPPESQLTEQQRNDLTAWIRAGAVWPEHSTMESDAARLAEKWRKHWAFQPIKYPSGMQPGIDPAAIDQLIDAQLDAVGLNRSTAASPRTLIRRAATALIGLPPEQQWLRDGEEARTSGRWENWYSAYIDRLLGSPHFGEKWARHWLDVSRYADTKGYVFQENREYPEAWKYRQWVIESLNADRPYDDFLRRQISADRLPGSDDPQQLAAMGFLTLGRRFLNNPHDIIDDRIDVVSRGILGLTVACARCHDHKFDPIPTSDYYSLYGIFASSNEPKDEPSPLRLVDRPQPVEPVIFIRGNSANRGDRVPRRFLSAISGPDAKDFSDGSGRLELAKAITSPDNPLTARVAVNRIWMHLFGRGFVDTPSDFGVRTDRPQHHALLDLLAADLMHHNWSLKQLIRRIVLSQTWQQKSDQRPDALLQDPENRLFARANRRRLDFEAQHDAVLVASGRLDRSIGGPSEDLAANPQLRRRAVYARIDRQNLPGLFRTFDLASPDSHAPRRFETTIPQQGLFYLNSPFILGQAEEISRLADSQPTPEARIQTIYERVLMRPPEDDELLTSLQFVKQITEMQAPLQGGATGWSYGFGSRETGQDVGFTPLTTINGDRLQSGSELPDPAHGWTFLSKDGGHPGVNPDHCVIRRWTADSDCRLVILGSISHPADQGDGVRLSIKGPENQLLQEVLVFNQDRSVPGSTLEIRKGQRVSFIVDCLQNPSHDSFRSQFTIRQIFADGSGRMWNSESDFSVGSRQPLSPHAQLAQTLLMTNEFLFVD